jgi:hypothetical protein
MSVNMRRLCVALVLEVLGLTGCVSWSHKADDGSRTTHILGYTRVRQPAVWSSGQPPCLSAVARLGISLGGDGLLLGYDDRTLVSFPPSEHGYLFFNVRSEEDLQRVLEIIQREEFREYPLCLTVNALGASSKSAALP